LALNKTAQANEFCLQALKLKPGDCALNSLKEKIQSVHTIEAEKARNRTIDEHARKKKQFVLSAALKARNIKLRKSSKLPELEGAEIHLSPDSMDPGSMLVFPAVFLYPIHAQSDFVKRFTENDTIVDHLSYMLPLPWDTEQDYRIDSVGCYMDTTAGGIAKVGKKLSLLQTLTAGKTEVEDGLVRIYVVPFSQTGKWIEEMKKRKPAED
jgi:hypothetical protein